MTDTQRPAQKIDGMVRVRAVYNRRVFHDDGTQEVIAVAELPESEQTILTREYPPNVEVGRVAVARGMKVNMGNYESADVWASVTLPAVFEEMNDAFGEAEDRVNKQLAPTYKKLVAKAKEKEQAKAASDGGKRW